MYRKKSADWAKMVGPTQYSATRLSCVSPFMSAPETPLLFRDGQLGLGGIPLLPSPVDRSPDIRAGNPQDPVYRKTDHLMKTLWPEMASHMAQVLHAVYTLSGREDASECCYGCVSGHDWETLPMTIYALAANPESYCEGWVHEEAHVCLHSMGVHMEDWDDTLLLNGPDELYESPVRKDKLRPAGAILQGFYSYVHVVEWEWRLTDSGCDLARPSLEVNQHRLEEGLLTIDKNLRFTPAGKVFWRTLAEWTTELLERKV